MGNPSCCIHSSPGCKRPICKPKGQPTLYDVRAVVITSRRNLTQKKKAVEIAAAAAAMAEEQKVPEPSDAPLPFDPSRSILLSHSYRFLHFP